MDANDIQQHIDNYDPKKGEETLRNTLVAMITSQGSVDTSDYMFYGHMLAKCKKSIDTSLNAPAAVSFQNTKFILHINPIFFSMFTLPERLGVLKHEMLHILNGHLDRLGDKEMKGWNYATDCAINQLINKQHLPEGCILPDNYPSTKKAPKDKTAEFYYGLLDDPENPDNSDEEDPDNKEGSDKNPQGNGPGNLMDDHGKWQESTGDPELQKDITKDMIEKAVDSTIKSKGRLPANLSDYLSLHTRKNEVNWKTVLRNIVGNKKANTRRTVMRRDRRFPNRPDIKGKTKDRVFNLLVVSDVSGSVSDTALVALLGEIRHICKLTNTPVDLIQVDTVPHKPEKLKANTQTVERKAQGGTELAPALDMAKEHRLDYAAVVVTTDGYLWDEDIIPFKNTKKPIIWLIEKEGKIMPEMQEGLMRAFILKE